MLQRIAWCIANDGIGLHPVGRKAPNAWGLLDMLGNASEWVQDWYGDYPGGSVTDPAGPRWGSLKVLRGGHGIDDYDFCRVTSQREVKPDSSSWLLISGVRLFKSE